MKNQETISTYLNTNTFGCFAWIAYKSCSDETPANDSKILLEMALSVKDTGGFDANKVPSYFQTIKAQ